jgi:hypothetical protein
MKGLKPCPFCGSEPRYIERKSGFGRHGIGCSNMECIIWLPDDVRLRELHNYCIAYVEKSCMVKAWNRRRG